MTRGVLNFHADQEELSVMRQPSAEDVAQKQADAQEHQTDIINHCTPLM